MGYTPLLTALKAEAQRKTARFHMPGHKGRSLPYNISFDASIDFTELDVTGNLYEGFGPIAEAESLWADALGARNAFFLTGGATQGVYAMCSVIAHRQGRMDPVIVDRASHKSLYHGLALHRLIPHYLPITAEPSTGVPIPPAADAVKRALQKYPNTPAVFITTPNYYGRASELAPIAELCRKYGAWLVVDEAHGAHLPFLKHNGSAVSQGANLAVCSLHKTLPAPGQAAVLTASSGFNPSEIRRACALHGTSSPSYVIMASIDALRDWLSVRGKITHSQLAEDAGKLHKHINSDTVFTALQTEDPLRLVVNTGSAGITGWDAAAKLNRDFGVVCEMSDRCNIVFILSPADRALHFNKKLRLHNNLHRLLAALQELGAGLAKAPAINALKLPPRAEPVFSLHEMVNMPASMLPLSHTAGHVAAEILSPYPPGCPIVAPGERITNAQLSYLLDSGIHVSRPTAVLL